MQSLQEITREFLALRLPNFSVFVLYELEQIERFSNLHYCTFNDSLYIHLWSADISKTFPQLIMSRFIFSQYFFK